MNAEIDNLWQMHSIQLASIPFINFYLAPGSYKETWFHFVRLHELIYPYHIWAKLDI